MKSATELKELAWQRLWAERWFGKLFGGGLLLSVCGYAVNVVLGGILGRLGVDDWQDYLLAVRLNRADLTTPVPNLTADYLFRATSATLLEMFISYIMAGILSYGTAVVLLKCLRNDEQNWLGELFGGFRDPFGMFWLQLRLVLIYGGWALLSLLPAGALVGATLPLLARMSAAPSFGAMAGVSAFYALAFGLVVAALCVPFYKYRFCFLIKAEHPDWSAGRCLAACRELMAGNKMRSFRLDCSYWKPIALALLPALSAVASASLALYAKEQPLLLSLLIVVAVLSVVALIPAMAVLGQYVHVGQGFLYRELADAA